MPEKGYPWVTVEASVPRWLPDVYRCAWIDLAIYYKRYPLRKLVILAVVRLTPTMSLLKRSDAFQDTADGMADPHAAIHVRMLALAHDMEIVRRACYQPGVGTERYTVRLQWRQ